MRTVSAQHLAQTATPRFDSLLGGVAGMLICAHFHTQWTLAVSVTVILACTLAGVVLGALYRIARPRRDRDIHPVEAFFEGDSDWSGSSGDLD